MLLIYIISFQLSENVSASFYPSRATYLGISLLGSDRLDALSSSVLQDFFRDSTALSTPRDVCSGRDHDLDHDPPDSSDQSTLTVFGSDLWSVNDLFQVCVCLYSVR